MDRILQVTRAAYKVGRFQRVLSKAISDEALILIRIAKGVDVLLKELSTDVLNVAIKAIRKSICRIRNGDINPYILFLSLITTLLFHLYFFGETDILSGRRFLFRVENGVVTIGFEQPADRDMDKEMLESVRWYAAKRRRVDMWRRVYNRRETMLNVRMVSESGSEEELEI